MKKYELMIIISSQITDSEIETRLKGIKEMLGNTTNEECWGMRSFAQPIKTQEKGYYMLWNFLKEPHEIEELSQQLNIYPDVIRFLLIQVPEDYTPITFLQIQADLEQLRKEKAEKRAPKQQLKPTFKKAEMPKTKAKPEIKPVKSPEPVKPETAPPPKRTLDQKLDDILSDDDLGL